jgi:hypothetical protein
MRDPGKDNGQHGHEEGNCHFIEEMLAVPLRDSDVARRSLEQLRIEHGIWGDQQLLGQLEGLGEDDVEAIKSQLELIQVSDPHESARALRTKGGVRASPIHGLGHLSHSRVMSGDGPYKAEEQLDGHPVGEDAAVIAVVDSGIVPEDHLEPYEWMTSPSVEAEDRDREEPDPLYGLAASHGTFVVSRLRLCAPEHAVWLARAEPRKIFSGPRHNRPAPYPTTELDVVAALARLSKRLGASKRKVAALNLSLGAHSDSPCEDDFLLAVKLALVGWRQEFDCPIFAAGGNVEAAVDPNPVYPGAFEDVVAVGALDDFGVEVVWNAQGHTSDGSWRSWIDERAYGVDRVGLSGNPKAPVVRWSGSSFATAEATAAS